MKQLPQVSLMKCESSRRITQIPLSSSNSPRRHPLPLVAIQFPLSSFNSPYRHRLPSCHPLPLAVIQFPCRHPIPPCRHSERSEEPLYWLLLLLLLLPLFLLVILSEDPRSLTARAAAEEPRGTSLATTATPIFNRKIECLLPLRRASCAEDGHSRSEPHYSRHRS
jgi:hypothetical protein